MQAATPRPNTVMAAARANLVESLAQPYIETAIEIANGSADFLGKELVEALKEVKNDSLMAEFATVNASAIAELRSYAQWLQKEKENDENEEQGNQSHDRYV